MAESVRDWIIRNEGVRQFPYQDIMQKWSIGVGRNLSDNGLTIEECMMLFENDIQRCIQ